jgi:hypothetical protein
VHGTTHQVVLEAWHAEQAHLQRVAGRPAYPYVPMARRRVARDAFVIYGTNRYSVPWPFAGRDVWVREVDELVEIRLPQIGSPSMRAVRGPIKSSPSQSTIRGSHFTPRPSRPPLQPQPPLEGPSKGRNRLERDKVVSRMR